MEKFKYQPLAGLLSLRTEEKSNDIFTTISYIEEKVHSSPKGNASTLALLFYLLFLLQKEGLEFYVKGGIISQYYLKDRARPTNDLDIIIKEDGDSFYQKVEKIIQNEKGFSITRYISSPADMYYYYDYFNIKIEIDTPHLGKIIVAIDGISSPLIYDNMNPVTYDGPEIICPNFKFQGVPLEFSLADKIIAVTNELSRPCKHLVDIYNFIHLDIDMNLLKKYLDLVIENDNRVRKNLNIEIVPYQFIIKEDKVFMDSYLRAIFQAGINVPFNDMKDEVNKWLATNIG